ncbi:MAG: transglycosylase domain-containing protein, partial [Selenomonadaceae bacterium]|nr:transglycosylase domain-containing protein [Selenomonadaceae bacterium]
MESRRERQAMDEVSSSTSRRSAKKNKSSVFTLKRVIIGFIILTIMLGIGTAVGFVTASINTKADLSEVLPPVSSQIYDSAGNELANIHATENRLPVKIEAVPINLQQAFIAVEDNRFYEHKGIDPRGLLRAIWSNINDRGISEGGSTITQQLAKNAYLTQERTIQRKIQEMFLALKLEKQYTKQEILELYLNQIYFGQGAYGVQAAAKTYFGKNVEELDLAECALLAGIPKSPNYYSPFNSIQAAKDRRSVVLDQMVKYGYIGKMEAADAKLEELNLVQPEQISDNKEAAYFIDYVTQLLIDKYGADAVYKDGLKVYTTIDMDIQKKAEEAVLSNLPNYGADENGIVQPQAALVAIDPKTGYIKAMIGGRGTDQFNRATLAERQPGSVFKPFVFAAALENDFTPDTVIEDSPITINGWSPRNDNGRFSGSVTMRTVATFSMNVPTVKIAQKIGMDKPIYYAQEMGITT